MGLGDPRKLGVIFFILILAGSTALILGWLHGRGSTQYPSPIGKSNEILLTEPGEEIAIRLFNESRLFHDINETIHSHINIRACEAWAASEVNATIIYQELIRALREYRQVASDSLSGHDSLSTVEFLILYFSVDKYYAAKYYARFYRPSDAYEAALKACVLSQVTGNLREIASAIVDKYGTPPEYLRQYIEYMLNVWRGSRAYNPSNDYKVNSQVPPTATLISAQMALISVVLDCRSLENLTGLNVTKAREAFEEFLGRLTEDPYLLMLFYAPLLGDPRVGPIRGPAFTSWVEGIEYGPGGFIGLYSLENTPSGKRPNPLIARLYKECMASPVANELSLEDVEYLHFYAWMRLLGLDRLLGTSG